jgi:hypothetical protein
MGRDYDNLSSRFGQGPQAFEFTQWNREFSEQGICTQRIADAPAEWSRQYAMLGLWV